MVDFVMGRDLEPLLGPNPSTEFLQAISPITYVNETDWNPGFDVIQDQSRATRHTVFDRLEREGMTIAAGHFPKPGFGKLVRVERKRIWQTL